ncbi:MAG: hypothetical protein P8Y67_10085 [Alphaproteobacteria bacterium]
MHRFQGIHGAVGEPRTVRGLRVAFDLFQRFVAAHRHDFVRRAPRFGQTAATGFA